jgi:ATP-dependent Lon protease
MGEIEHSIDAVNSAQVPGEVPLVFTRDLVIFPHMVVPLLIEDERAIKSVDTAVSGGHRVVAIFGQKSTEVQAVVQEVAEEGAEAREIGVDDLYSVGTAAQVARMQRMPDGRMQILVHGIARVSLKELVQTKPFPLGRVERLEPQEGKGAKVNALVQNAEGLFEKVVSMMPDLPKEILPALKSVPVLDQKADFIASQLGIDFDERQQVLAELDVGQRFEILNKLLGRETQILELRQKINSQAEGSMTEAQREFYLRQQLKAIREELGEGGDEAAEIDELREKVHAVGMPEDVLKEAERELGRMAKMPQSSAEYTVSRTYLDWLVEMPWNEATEDRIDIDEAQQVLDDDHYGLEKPKERILEYLAVRRMKNDMRGPILCLVGPPGTGKTSLGRSVARALGKEFARISLGGVRDESEIRGHRRTYVGALPGRIIQGLRRAGKNNPVFMLDELDKLGSDFRGDPSAALLEVLDPEQNNSFEDHYLDVPFDLSKVLFIATANTLHTIPPALLDRMEVLELSGYTEAEKVSIAKRYLVPRQLAEHGLSEKKLEIDEDVLLSLARRYTREAGLRNLEREVGTLCRKVARRFAQGRRRKVHLKGSDLKEYLGAPRFSHEVAEEANEVGVAAGLAVTSAGGDVLFVEATTMPGKGNLNLTGQVGDVMKESVQAALTYTRSRWEELDLDESFHKDLDVHIHVPAGAVPKDGPSAGITMATVLASVYTRRPVRKNVAMTGEITLRGKVLPIGGVRDKVLAAHRAGLKTVLLPEENRKDFDDIPETVLKDVNIHFVGHMDEVIEYALLKRPRRRKAQQENGKTPAGAGTGKALSGARKKR